MDPIKVTMTQQDPNDPSKTISTELPEVSREQVGLGDWRPGSLKSPSPYGMFEEHTADLKAGPWVTLSPVTDFDGKHLIVNTQGSSRAECQLIEAFDNEQLTIRWPQGTFQAVKIVLMREEYSLRVPDSNRRHQVVSYMPGFYQDVYGAMIWIPLYKVRVLKTWADAHTKK